MWITWKHQDTDFPQPWTLESKVEIFYEGIYGWQLNIADLMVNGGERAGDGKTIEPIPNSGFACLHVCLSYFETISKYYDGFEGRGESRTHFKEGVKIVFPLLRKADHQEFLHLVLDWMYEGARCGLYHASMTLPGIALGQSPGPMGLEGDNLVINPNTLPKYLKCHLCSYRADLSNQLNTTLRKNFERRFDYDHKLPT
jgi:hypothetical protein